jgi:hypothetical protein
MPAEDTGTPHLSIVAAARNDDHGGGFLTRLQLFVDGLADACSRHDLDAELVLVEWNPPPDRPRLAEAVRWPELGSCRVRIVEVPPQLHRLHEHADAVPLFQMIAKNVGLRRARGRFVLATNVDVLFSDELARALAPGRLEPGRVYRVDRQDVAADTDWPASPQARLQACADNVVRVNVRDETVDLRTGDVLTIYDRPSRLPAPVARTVELARDLRANADLAFRRTVLALVRPPGRSARRMIATAGTERARLQARVHELREEQRIRVARGRLHTNTCGDFTLMAREHWEELRGYPELRVTAWHLDSMLLYCAHYAGLRETYLPHPLYHVEHARFDDPATPQVSYEELGRWALRMHRSGEPIVSNGEDWGLGGHHLRESAPAPEPAEVA